MNNKILTTTVSGAILPLAFAPFKIWPIAIIVLAWLIYSIHSLTPKHAALRGLYFGLGYFGVGASWIYVSIHVYGQVTPLIAGFITCLFVLLLSLYPCLFAYLVKKINITNPALAVLGIPALWVITEWLRSTLFTGFPWLLIGYTTTDSWLAGFAPFVGVYGCSFLVIMLGCLLIIIMRDLQLKPYYAVFSFLGIILLGYILQQIQWGTSSQQAPTTVSLIQPNTPQEFKWDKAFLATTINTLHDLTLHSLNSDIIIWPEAAIPLPLPEAEPVLNYWESLTRAYKFTLITGILNRVNQTDYNNSLISRSVSSSSYYAKQHLVPFGEYIPFQKYLNKLLDILALPMPDTQAGDSNQPAFFAGNMMLAPAICYEIAYPNIVFQHLPEAQAIVTVSNDTWFGNSIGPKQHLQMAQMRSIESARYLLRATNNGISAIINTKGQITNQAPSFQQYVLKGEFQPYHGATPLMYYGTNGVLGLIVLIAIIAICSNYQLTKKDSY